MTLEVTETTVRNILTRSTGFLRSVVSHSAQPYRGCTLGSSLCGVGCYVQHNAWLTRGRPWGSFLDVRINAAESYVQSHERERRWARRVRGSFGVFVSSSTEPFLPQEARYGVTTSLLDAMRSYPPDTLIVQTHTHRVAEHADRLAVLATTCRLRVHLSIETDRERIEGLPPPASPVSRRFEAAAALRDHGVPVVVTIAPLLPIADPERFFARIASVADACVIDHFIEGDGSPSEPGARTRKTRLPRAMEGTETGSTTLAYRDRMVAIAREHLPGRVGVHVDGFAGRYLP